VGAGRGVGGIGVGVAGTGFGVGVGGIGVGVASTGSGGEVAFTGAGAIAVGFSGDDSKPSSMAALLGTSASRMSRAIMQATSNTVTRTANTTMAAIVYMTLSLIGTSFHPPPQLALIQLQGLGPPLGPTYLATIGVRQKRIN